MWTVNDVDDVADVLVGADYFGGFGGEFDDGREVGEEGVEELDGGRCSEASWLVAGGTGSLSSPRNTAAT